MIILECVYWIWVKNWCTNSIMIKWKIKNKYGSNSRLLFTNTDSLMYEVKTEDLYDDFITDKEMLDFCNRSTESKYYDNSKN